MLCLVWLNSFAQHQNNYQELIQGILLNHQDLQDATIILIDANRNIYLNAQDLAKWNIIIPNTNNFIKHDNNTYYPLFNFAGSSYTQNKSNNSIDIIIPAKYMPTSNISGSDATFVTPSKPTAPGAYLNYDLLGQKSPGFSQLGGIFTGNFFNRWGSLNSSFLEQNSRNDGLGSSNHIARLNSYWQSDYPENMRTLIVGDTLSSPGMWGQSVSFGGIHYGTNFGTRPAFTTFPLPKASGTANVPTALSLYANNVLVSQSNVNAGPFNVTNIPVVTGSGMLNVVSTDVLGRQQIISVPYYVAPELLKKGLQSYSIESGFIRNNYGIASNDYGKFLTVGTQSYGFTDNFTGQWHSEVLRGSQNLGLGGTFLWSNFGVFNLASAVGHNGRGIGKLALINFQRQTSNGYSFFIGTQLTTNKFRQLGYGDNQVAPAAINQAYCSIPAYGGSINLSYTLQNNRESPKTDTLGLSYNKTLFKGWNLFIGGYTNVTSTKNKSVYLTISKALTDDTTATIGSSTQTGSPNNGANFTITRSLPRSTGYGYNITGNGIGSANPSYHGYAYGQNTVGAYSVGVSRQNKQIGYQAEAAGSVVTLDKEVYLARSVNNGNSFAIVEVPGYKDIKVFSNNLEVTSTNKRGNALVTDLLPYQNNYISINPEQLPLDTKISKTSLSVVPYANTGLVAKFPVSRTNGAIMNLIYNKTKQPVPLGAIVLRDSNHEQFIVGEDGLTYVTDLEPTNVLHVKWDGQVCEAKVNYQASNDPLPDLGKIICEHAG